MRMKSNIPVYESIAMDVAERIVNGEFAVGDKISGRTLLASQYNVSPETIRKAMGLLGQANVVAVSQGKEILVQSQEQAEEFIRHHLAMHSAYSLKQELEFLMEKKNEINNRFDEIIVQITRYTDRLRNLQPFNPVEVYVSENASAVGRSVAQLGLWQRTGATLIAIRRGMEVIISPGAGALLQAGDRLIVVGSGDILEKVNTVLQE
ncbi:TrkA C-terminal domain-containing protein [Pelosinus baikalensis]|nr:TrkA C-terminal domain-containing protein [Pelosinus baikalensis]